MPVPPTFKWVKIWSKAWNCQYESFWTDTEPMPGTKVKNGKNMFSNCWAIRSCGIQSAHCRHANGLQRHRNGSAQLRYSDFWKTTCCGGLVAILVPSMGLEKAHSLQLGELKSRLKRSEKMWRPCNCSKHWASRQADWENHVHLSSNLSRSLNLRWPWRTLRLAV